MRSMSSTSPRPKAPGDLPASQQPSANIPLGELIKRYLAASGSFGNSVALSVFGFTRPEIESAFSQFDEDYMISRFLHFSNRSGETFRINGFPQTHISIDADIQSIL